MRGHEIHCRRRRELGGHAQITFVFPVFVVHQDHHLAVTNRLKGEVNAFDELGVELKQR